MRIHPSNGWLILEPSTARERTRGLLGRRVMGPTEALLLRRCRSVHTFGMRFGIDVVLLDRRFRPIGVIRMAPGKILLPRRGVRHILEVAAGRGDAAAQEIQLPAPGAVPVETQRSPWSSST
jgi:uncharacterized membrane protein (UPF0127 family)